MYRLTAVIGISLLQVAMLAQPASAEDPVEPHTPRDGNVAVIDIERIVAESRQYQAALRDLGADESAHKSALEQDHEDIARLVARRAEEDRFSVEADRLTEKIIEAQRRLQVKQTLWLQDHAKRRTRLRKQLLAQMQQEVGFFARKYNIVLVLPYRSQFPDPESLSTAKARFTSGVVYHRGIDVTNQILQRLNPPRHLRGGGG